MGKYVITSSLAMSAPYFITISYITFLKYISNNISPLNWYPLYMA